MYRRTGRQQEDRGRESFPCDGSHSQASNASHELPKTVVRTLNLGSRLMSMDFHPIHQTLLLVGTDTGVIVLWEVVSEEILVDISFTNWEMDFTGSVSVNRVSWSPDGLLFGVAYSRQILQIYSYHGGGDARQHLEIHAHDGGINGLAFFHSNNQLCVITCGDDKTVKVWDAETGIKKYTFEGHNAPVYSICTRYKENNQEQIIFSMALDGNIRAWLFDDIRSRVHYDVPGGWYTTMRYSLDGTRLFSCGISKEGAVHFDTTNNCVLAAGDDFTIKYWDMNNVQLLTTVVVDGGLPARSFIRFNKDGCLLAVSANNNDVRILANSDGLQLLLSVEQLSYDTTSRETEVLKPSITEEPHDKSNIQKLTEISESAQCRSLELPENMKATKISRLTYTNKGDSILILASNAVHLLWKWPGSVYDSNGRVKNDALLLLLKELNLVGLSL